MRKQELVRAVAGQTGQSTAQATAAVEAVFASVQKALVGGDEVTIPGFGSFRVVERAAREGRNPQTGQPVSIEARRSPVFRPAARLKEAVAADGSSSA